MGRMIGQIPGAVEHGLGSADGHRLIATLTVAASLYALSLLRGSAEDLLSTLIQARMSAYAQHRLVDALLVFDVHSDHALPDLTEHALDSLGDAFPSIPFGIAVAQLDRLMHAGRGT